MKAKEGNPSSGKMEKSEFHKTWLHLPKRGLGAFYQRCLKK